jgi:predicted RNA-binding Zn-ribbon protein involved in translation (DUF1610 family)
LVLFVLLVGTSGVLSLTDSFTGTPATLLIASVVVIAATFFVLGWEETGERIDDIKEEPLTSMNTGIEQLCPRCGAQMYLRRDKEKPFHMACPGCGLGSKLGYKPLDRSGE